MKKRDIVVTSAVYLVFTLLSCAFAGLFSAMVVRFANKFAELSFIANAGVRAVALVLFAAFFLVLLSYKYGYHNAYFDKTETFLSVLLASLVHFVLSFITLFSPWISGATKPISGLVTYGTNYMSDVQTKNIPIFTLVLAGAVVLFVHGGLLVLGTYIGTKERLADRAALLGENDHGAK